VTLVADFAAFYAEHERCRELDGSSVDNGNRVIVTCSCGAVFSRLMQDLDPSDRPDNQFRRGVSYAGDQDYAGAVRAYRWAAVQGDANAQNNLGVLHVRGRGFPQDYAEGVKWFRRAAEQGLAGAQFNLGRRYFNGQGVPQDDAEAVKWFRRAAEQGFADAQNDLGYMYGHGRGVPQDYLAAYSWFSLAASRAESRADGDRSAKNRDLAASKLTPDQIAEAQRLASAWRPKPEQPSE
jgi:uncharacterized protein